MFMECPAGCSWNGWPDDVECAGCLADAQGRGQLHLRQSLRFAKLLESQVLLVQALGFRLDTRAAIGRKFGHFFLQGLSHGTILSCR